VVSACYDILWSGTTVCASSEKKKKENSITPTDVEGPGYNDSLLAKTAVFASVV
jgi:hypothetical protein